METYDAHKLLIANRGEIAVRIIRTAKRLGLRTVAIYTPSDALSPHVLQADEAVELTLHTPDASEASAYLSGENIVRISKERGVTLVHPGYGFLSENVDFARDIIRNGITWVGPRPEVIQLMGIKHVARKLALKAGVGIVPGSDDLLATQQEALSAAIKCGFPIMLKATAGGGGMGMVICADEEALRRNFSVTQNRAKSLFDNSGVFIERYYPAARHIEIQVFGNGLGDVVHMRERECSVQRRHQKVIEETPSPFCLSHPGLRERMCEVAVRLSRSIKYDSAGTVEFLVDETTADFYFLEMNTRIQVEHPVTEEIHPGLDLVELMLAQAIAQKSITQGLPSNSYEMQQATYDILYQKGQAGDQSHCLEGRIYAEDPYEGFVPSPGLLQYVSFGEKIDWLRVETWVDTGMSISPHFDPLLAKFIVTGSTRDEALARFLHALSSFKLLGPPNNVQYLEAIGKSKTFQAGEATTTFLSTFSVSPRAFKVLSSAIECTIQDLPGRLIRLGMPRSGPMDELAFSAGNILVGNSRTIEGLEIIVVPGIGFSVQFFVPAVVAVTGKDVRVILNGVKKPLWSRVVVPANGRLDIQAEPSSASVPGLRAYLTIRGGFPNIPAYLGSKSTSMGLGGYQGRSLMKGDLVQLGSCSPEEEDHNVPVTLSNSFIPTYPSHWVVHVLSGPHDDNEFITENGIDRFYKTHWRVSPSSNRLGIRLETPSFVDKIEWARDTGGDGGSHPSNILDNGYAPGTININGDTPVILTKEGPDMGGYLCMCTVATSEMWKLGQLAPGSTVEFRRITWDASLSKATQFDTWLTSVSNYVASPFTEAHGDIFELNSISDDAKYSPILHTRHASSDDKAILVCFRQAGDSAILVEFGTMELDISASDRFAHVYDPFLVILQSAFLNVLIDLESAIPENMSDMQFPGRRVEMPIALDDRWNKEALHRYMASTRDKAVYLPSNVEYLANNNGLADSGEALRKLVLSDWLVLGVGFYLACPFLIPIDPRCRLIGQKMNPSRTFTPRGAIGIAGPVAAIYPIESPGGYQLYGRTLPGWQTWGKGTDFEPSRPWLLQAFDQIHFTPVTEDEYIKLERKFDSGQYSFKIEPATFSIRAYTTFVDSVANEISEFRQKQKEASSDQETREKTLLEEWEQQKVTTTESSDQGYAESSGEGSEITASLFANVWKIQCLPGDVIESESQVVVILEAMKTEIPVLAGEEHVGKTVKGFGKGVKEGSSVVPGGTLIVLE